ncbi:ATP-binding protein [Lentzea sp. NPDC003310]|uniref:ATP-binding protein n=1 Tax=Lentzea sp. NPDC003310 TaxID=3154447 RepID=UPI0033A8BE81
MTLAAESPESLIVDLAIERQVVLPALRDWVRGALDGLGAEHCYDVQLVVTELAANVLDHTTGAGRLRLFRGGGPCRVTVEVDDQSAVRPRRGRSRLGGHRGNGMALVAGLSSAWGARLGLRGGKTVFAVVRCGTGGLVARECGLAGV